MFGYLKRTAADGIIFGLDDKLVFYGTSDAAHNVLQQVPGWPATQGITGYHFQLFGGPVAWRSSSQKLTSHSSTESELYALDEATRELAYLKKLLRDFDVQNLPSPMTIGQDNISTITLADPTNETFNPRTKHIALRFMYINSMQQANEVVVKHLSTDCIPADALTKPLHPTIFSKHMAVIMGRQPIDWRSPTTATAR